MQESAGTGRAAFATRRCTDVRAARRLFGNGALDELGDLQPVAWGDGGVRHYHSTDVNTSLTPTFTITPAKPIQGQNTTLDARLDDTNATITDYKGTSTARKLAVDTARRPL